MKKIVIIGAGSWNFTRAISRDIFTFPALADSHIVLVDIPTGEAYMHAAEKIIQKTIAQGGYPATVESTLDRRAALDPERLKKALGSYDCVISAWADDRLIGLVAAMDDGEMTAYIHYLLVDPQYRHCGIGRTLMDKIKAHYKDYLKIVLVAYTEVVGFYNSLGFKVAEDSIPMYLTDME